MIDGVFLRACVFANVHLCMCYKHVCLCVCVRSCVGRYMYVSQKRTSCVVPQKPSVWFCCFSEAGSLTGLVLIK